ncbi:ABC-type polar amino acid transport system, ATPase component [Thermoproteus uzoniensis 768-20]|uniref:ABC-type polar amino acid transport system, ATPase component n=1 Tax=Thermoproteus uzoniensis (strain 768-20) TaxID=999630 RepID=F2L3N1_THEU7|nr:ATP-binding cassette domain-containing protein [Thermoproteus uzoniensis]AEA12015.1 ABC-type polar amino acid transport system, ATPase component [Thermoproteus uzoniensis 768-20]
MLQGLDLWKSFNGVTAVRGVYITLYTGINCIKGPNGAGKSTLLRMLSLLERPDRGTIVVFGKRVDADRWAEADRLRGRIAYVPQTSELFAVSVKSLLSMCGDRAKAGKWAAYFGLTRFMDRNAMALSPGIRRRLQLALALACAKEALLLDEPESYLDDEARGLLADALRDVADSLVVGYVSHDEPLVPCRHSYFMSGGTISPTQ